MEPLLLLKGHTHTESPLAREIALSLTVLSQPLARGLFFLWIIVFASSEDLSYDTLLPTFSPQASKLSPFLKLFLD